VLGHGAEATGPLLGIATQTVASHRKRAYAKLGIGSQAELFERWRGPLD
jgi:DNA-binding CsgD family transcriptional regulator